MHVVLIIYKQHLSPPNVLSGFGRSERERARWKPRAGAGAGRGLWRSSGEPGEASLGIP